MQKLFILLGVAFLALGLLWPLISKLGLGRLPGDIAVERDGFSFFFPIATMILVSVALTLIMRFLGK